MDLLGGTTIMEAVFTFMFLAVMMIAFNSWTVFARLATARIEREIRASGLPRPAPWDGVGYVRPVQREPDQRA